MDKPRIFPGSSGKQEKLLQALTRGLEEVAHAVSARKAGVYLRADPGDMKTLDGHDNGQRAKLIAKQLRRSGQRSAQIASWGAHLLESGRSSSVRPPHRAWHLLQIISRKGFHLLQLCRDFLELGRRQGNEAFCCQIALLA
jgi:hypothetical protein